MKTKKVRVPLRRLVKMVRPERTDAIVTIGLSRQLKEQLRTVDPETRQAWIEEARSVLEDVKTRDLTLLLDGSDFVLGPPFDRYLEIEVVHVGDWAYDGGEVSVLDEIYEKE